MSDKLLTTKEAAEYIRHKEGTLENWRSNNEGPEYCKPLGKVFYRQSDLDKWLSGEKNNE